MFVGNSLNYTFGLKVVRELLLEVGNVFLSLKKFLQLLEVGNVFESQEMLTVALGYERFGVGDDGRWDGRRVGGIGGGWEGEGDEEEADLEIDNEESSNVASKKQTSEEKNLLEVID